MQSTREIAPKGTDVRYEDYRRYKENRKHQ